MGKDILFKWEDSPALKHHCGFCERPLSHPGARTSCFGVHAEPCHRFHQAMFMRNRAHCCSMCIGADQAHHKRHQEIAEVLRIIYEICGEEWSLIPTDEHERGRIGRRESDAWEDEGEDQWSLGGVHKRKDRKEQKRLVRAASRRRVITLEEVQYLESVLHPAGSSSDTEGPRNPEEIDEIERHLRYNAQVYNTGHKRRLLKEFARAPDAELDFEGEMDRIMEALGVAELLKRNSKNTCLSGKELKHFLDSITEFKRCVVEDLVLLKKDELEVRMRRAAYLRYANRSSFDILEQRYAEKDWKTGEKFSGAPAVQSVSSGSATAIEEEWEEEDEETAVDWRHETPTPKGPDLRHLAHVHKRIGSDGKLEDCVTVRQSPSRTSAKPHSTPKRTLPHLRLVSTPRPAARESLQHYTPVKLRTANVPRSPLRYSPRQVRKGSADENGWQSVGRSARKVSMPVKRQKSSYLPTTSVWASGASTHSADDSSPTTSSSQDSVSASEDTYPPSEPLLNNAPDKHTRKGPLRPSLENKAASVEKEQQAGIGHPPVEQKKAKKKKQREAERKARRIAERERESTSDTAVEDGAHKPSQSGIEDSTHTSKVNLRLGDHLASLTGLVQAVEEKMAKMADPLRLGREQLESMADGDYLGGPILPVQAPTDTDMSREAIAADKTPIHDFAALRAKNAKPNPAEHAVPFVGKATLVDISARNITKESKTVSDLAGPNAPNPASPSASEDSTRPVVDSYRHHSDWKKFTRQFKVDSLSHPGSIPMDTCAHNHTCPFEVAGIPDCPYHKPHCGHCDPRSELFFVVYPLKDPFFVGPYNFPRAQKIIAHFDADKRTERRTMLVDDSMLDWITTEGLTEKRDISAKTCTMPLELSYEVTDFFAGEPKGRLMLQTEEYRGTARSNAAAKPPLSEDEFEEIFDEFENGCGDSPNICFCETQHEYETEMVECTFRHCLHDEFHKSCVQSLGVDKVSKWYCPECERAMARMAGMLLDEVQLMRDGLPLPELTSLDILTSKYSAEDKLETMEVLCEHHASGRCTRGYEMWEAIELPPV